MTALTSLILFDAHPHLFLFVQRFDLFTLWLLGIRLLGQSNSLDMQEAKSLSHLYGYVQVYSNSWGPDDDGKTVMGPGRLTSMVLEQGTKKVGLRKMK